MSKETADSSKFCKLAWYDWIIYPLGAFQYPDKPLCTVKYDLEPVINVEPGMTRKIFQHKGEVVYIYMYQQLTLEETSDEKVYANILSFKENAQEHLGVMLKDNELGEIGIPNTSE